MTLKKELVVHIETNEQDEFIKINALDSDPGYFLLSLGQNRMVVNGQEIIEAISQIDYFKTMFAHESLAKAQRAAAPAKAMSINPVSAPRRAKKVAPEDEGALILEAQLRTGPTESELALERQTAHMQGETLVFKEK